MQKLDQNNNYDKWNMLGESNKNINIWKNECLI